MGATDVLLLEQSRVGATEQRWPDSATERVADLVAGDCSGEEHQCDDGKRRDVADDCLEVVVGGKSVGGARGQETGEKQE
jgi:hypothetical protein